MVIRPVVPADCSALAQLVEATIRVIHTDTFSPAGLEIWIADYSQDCLLERLREQTLFCCEENDHLSGMIGLNGSEIIGLYVHPEATGRGLGRQLVSHLEAFAKKRGIKELHLTSNLPMQGFYQRLGYEPKGLTLVHLKGHDYEEMRFVKDLTRP
jgi:GNAT superfamily N-acetyltransferase